MTDDVGTTKWRTVIGLLLFALALLVGLYIVRGGSDVAAKMYADFASAVVWLGVALAAGHGIQHLAVGGGLKGAIAALMTSAKPGEAAPEEPAK